MAVYPEKRKGKLTGKWIAEFTRNGERVARKRFNTKKDGDDWEGYMKLTGSPPPIEPEFATGPTFGEVAKEVRPKDASSQNRLAFLIARFGDRLVAELKTTDLDELVSDLLKRPGKRREVMSPATINRYLSAFSSVITHAVVRKYRPDHVTVPWQKETGRRLHWLTELQEKAVRAALVEAGHFSSATVMRALTTTGMRWGELAGLKPDQIEDNWVRLWQTKNSEARSAAITPELARELRELVASGSFPKYSTFRNDLKRAFKSAGLSPELCIHTLRHTTATRLVQKGVNLRIVQRYMGHKNIATTTIYAHVADDDLQTALEKISPHAGQGPEIAPQTVSLVPEKT
jgi:integrase